TSIERIVGVKDSSGDLAYFSRLTELKSLRPDWSVMMGPEALLGDAMQCGGDGGVSGGANLLPGLFVDFYESLVRGDQVAGDALRQKIMALRQIYEIGKYATRHIKATKRGLSLLGICDDFMAEHFHRFRQPQRDQVAAILRQLEMMPVVAD